MIKAVGTRKTSESSTVAELIKSAKKLFASRGFDSVSVREIGEAAGVNPALINYHFESKLELYRMLIETLGQERMFRIQTLLRPSKNAIEFKTRLELFIQDAFQNYINEPELHIILHRESHMESPVAEDIFKRTFFTSFNIIEDFFEHGIKAGYISGSRSAQIQAMIFLNILLGFMQKDNSSQKLLGKSIKDTNYRNQITQEILETLMCGIIITRPKANRHS